MQNERGSTKDVSIREYWRDRISRCSSMKKKKKKKKNTSLTEIIENSHRKSTIGPADNQRN